MLIQKQQNHYNAKEQILAHKLKGQIAFELINCYSKYIDY